MKSIIISLLLLFTVQAQDGVTRFFVDNTASGSNNGTSWTNAWTALTNVNWATITAGDTIYVSGGNSGDTTYYYDNDCYSSTPYTFASGNTVIICPSWEEGHNGRVIFTNLGESKQYMFEFMGMSNVKMTGFTFWDNRTTRGSSGLLIIGQGDNATPRDSLQIVENCHIRSTGLSNGVFLYGYRITIRNCLIENDENDYGTPQDMMNSSSSIQGHTIDGNIIIYRSGYTIARGDGNGVTTTNTSLTDTDLSGGNALITNYYRDAQSYIGCGGYNMRITSNTGNTFYGDGWVWLEGGVPPGTRPANGSAWETDDEHNDGIQFSNFYPSSYRLTNTVSNNLIVDTREEGTGWNNMIYNYSDDNTSSHEWLIYNNIFYAKKNNTSIGGIAIGGTETPKPITLKIFNNTLILKGLALSTLVTTWRIDTLIIKNNLLISDTIPNNIFNFALTDIVHQDVDYNFYAKSGGITSSTSFASQSVSYNWGNWLSVAGYDAHSSVGNSRDIIYSDKGSISRGGYYTTTGRDAAVDLSSEYPFLAYDALGNPRTGAWDMGALEYRPPLNKWVGLGHSVMERLWDYGTKLGDDTSTVPTMLEEVYRQLNSQHSWGADSIVATTRYFPAVHGTSWWAWQASFRNNIDDGSGDWLVGLIDTFDVIIIKGSINSTVMTGYGSADDTSGSGTTYQTMYNYKWQWRTILDVMKQHPEKFFIMMTGVPSPDWYNTPTGAQLSHEFCTWAKDTLAAGLDSYGAFPENVYVFDLFHYLSDNEYYLRDEYELSGVDEHPNSEAIRYVEPIWIGEVGAAVLAFQGFVETPTDTMPSFSFTALNNMELNTAYTANSTFSGADSTFTVYTTTGARFQINSGGYSTTAKTAVNGDVVYVETVTGASYSTGYTETIVAGGVSRDFTVTTKAYVPPSSGNGVLPRGSDGKFWKGANEVLIKVQ